NHDLSVCSEFVLCRWVKTDTLSKSFAYTVNGERRSEGYITCIPAQINCVQTNAHRALIASCRRLLVVSMEIVILMTDSANVRLVGGVLIVSYHVRTFILSDAMSDV